MTAVIAPQKNATAKRAMAAPAPKPLTTAPDPVGAAFRQISVHLRNAAQAEADGGLQSGHSTRLLRTAASMAGAHGGQGWSATGGQNEGYDIAALVIAALHVQKDRLDTYALAEIEAAGLLLADLTEDDNVLEGALKQYKGESADPIPSSVEFDGIRTGVVQGADGLVAELQLFQAQVMFAMSGVGANADTGSTPNGLLDMADDQLGRMIDCLEEGLGLDQEGQHYFLFRLGQCEHLIFGAIGAIERANRMADEEDLRELARLSYLDSLVEKAAELHAACDTGVWASVFKEAANAA